MCKGAQRDPCFDYLFFGCNIPVWFSRFKDLLALLTLFSCHSKQSAWISSDRHQNRRPIETFQLPVWLNTCITSAPLCTQNTKLLREFNMIQIRHCVFSLRWRQCQTKPGCLPLARLSSPNCLWYFSGGVKCPIWGIRKYLAFFHIGLPSKMSADWRQVPVGKKKEFGLQNKQQLKRKLRRVAQLTVSYSGCRHKCGS